MKAGKNSIGNCWKKMWKIFHDGLDDHSLSWISGFNLI